MRFVLLSIIGLLIAAPASAQSDQNVKREVESIASSHVDNFNKQNAAGIAALYTRDGIVVNPGGVQNPETNFSNAFKAGFNRQEVTVEQVHSIGPEVAIGVGEYSNSGQGQNAAPLQNAGRWTAVYVREAGTWKIRLLTAFPKPSAPAPSAPAK